MGNFLKKILDGIKLKKIQPQWFYIPELILSNNAFESIVLDGNT